MADILVIAAQCVWIVCEIVIKRKMTAREDNADKSSYKVLYLITLIGVAVGVTIGWALRFEDALGLYSDSAAFPVIGAALILLGLAVRMSAIATLKNYFTVNVAIREDHKLITGGLYRYIRHPAYAGGILSFIGCGLCYGNISSFIIIALPYILLILDRIHNEECVLT
jgi:protein-S-isoprenylcysteine O-methyltransferase Ste14